MTYTQIPLRVLTQSFLDSLAEMVKVDKGIDGDVVVIDLEEEQDTVGVCPTCSYSDYTICIAYTVDRHLSGYYVYSGRFESLVSRLVEL